MYLRRPLQVQFQLGLKNAVMVQFVNFMASVSNGKLIIVLI